MSVKLPFAVLNGKSVSVLDVPNGKACGCVCPECHRPLIARNGPDIQVEPHFSHMGHDNCAIDLRRLAALLLAEVLRECSHIHLPKIAVSRGHGQADKVLADSGAREISKVHDPDFSRFHPKVVIECEGRPLELFPFLSKAICGTSNHTENLNPECSALRVNLTTVFEQKDKERLKATLLSDSPAKRWLRSLLAEKWHRENPPQKRTPPPIVSRPKAKPKHSPAHHRGHYRAPPAAPSYDESDPDWKKMESWKQIPGMSANFRQHLERMERANPHRYQKPEARLERPEEVTYRCVICERDGLHKFRMRPILPDDPMFGVNRGVCDGEKDGKSCFSEYQRRKRAEHF